MSETQRFLVIDNTSERREQICSALHDGITGCASCFSSPYLSDKWELDKNIIEDCGPLSIILLHINDAKDSNNRPDPRILTEILSSSQGLLVLYSGGGVIEDRSGANLSLRQAELAWTVEDTDHRCWAIPFDVTEHDVSPLTRAVARIGALVNRDPRRIRQAIAGDSPFLPALAILCQGFLLATASTSREQREGAIAELLGAKTKGMRLADGFTKTVRTKCYWQALGDNAVQLLAILEYEWPQGCPESVKNLVTQALKDPSTLKFDIAAEALEDIARRLNEAK